VTNYDVTFSHNLRTHDHTADRKRAYQCVRESATQQGA